MKVMDKCIMCGKELDHVDDMENMALRDKTTIGFCKQCRKHFWLGRQKILKALEEKGEYKDEDVTIH